MKIVLWIRALHRYDRAVPVARAFGMRVPPKRMSDHPAKGSAMELQVRGVNLQPTEPIIEHAERRFNFALDRLSHRISRVIIKMSDPHRDGMMRCAVHVQLAGGAQPIIIEQSSTDLYSAIDRAADRVQTSVRRFMGRSRSRR